MPPPMMSISTSRICFCLPTSQVQHLLSCYQCSRREYARQAGYSFLAGDHGYAIGILIGAGREVRTAQLEKFKTAYPRFVARSMRAGPGVEAKMVMIAIPGNKARLVVEIDHQIQTKGLLVEGQTFIQIADVEMHVAENGAFRKTVKVLRFGQQFVGFEANRIHPDLTVNVVPLCART